VIFGVVMVQVKMVTVRMMTSDLCFHGGREYFLLIYGSVSGQTVWSGNLVGFGCPFHFKVDFLISLIINR
jgi:hypothetical protein